MALVVLVTVPSSEEGTRLARIVVESRLAACVNVIPGVTSIYRWEGRVEESGECLLIMKSDADRYPDLEDRIRSLHPYDVPEIIALPVEKGSPAYLDWIRRSLDAS
jgi:periplasmic divalent cation tolerance protein